MSVNVYNKTDDTLTKTAGTTFDYWVGKQTDWDNDSGNIPKNLLADGALVNITDDYDNAIGNLSQLTTSEKSNLVGAVNEVNSKTNPTNLINVDTTNFRLLVNKIGKLAEFYLYIKNDISLTAWTQALYTMNIRPYYDVILLNVNNVQSSKAVLRASNGQINCNSNVFSKDATYFGTFIYQ